MSERLHADVCVIGAGAGGAVVAAELAEGGADVLLLEQGGEHDADRFSAQPLEMLARLYRDGSQTMTFGTPPILLPLGRGLGGTTLVNSGTCFRTPAAVLDRWRSAHGVELDRAELDRCFERVERSISVSEVDPELAGANAAVVRRGAERLGWSHGYLRRNARGCVGSGVCAFGCPTSAKQHTGITYLPRARAAGARVLTNADAQRILVRDRRARGVRACIGGRDTEVLAAEVVLAAGTIHTPPLLARSGLGRESGALGHNLVLHPATAGFALMDEIVDMARGVPQSFYVNEFASQGIMFESVAGPPSYVAMALPLTGTRHAEAMTHYRRLAQFGLMVSDHGGGDVRLDALGGGGAARAIGASMPLVHYELSEPDVAKFRVGLTRLRELFEAAGAREVYLPLAPDVAPERARAQDLKLLAFHPLGTARADADPAHGVLDPDLRLHGVEGVHVADGSVMPSSLGVNPQLTIMALTTRLAFRLLGRRVPD